MDRRKGTDLADGRTAKSVPAGHPAMLQPQPTWDWNRVLTPRAVLLILPVAALILWAYPYWCPGPGGDWEVRWRNESAWSHGYLVPFLAVVIAHFRLTERPVLRLAPSAWGLVPLMAGLMIRIWSQTLMFAYPAYASFLLVVAGTIWLLLGWPMLRTLIVPVLYLGLMIPWEPKYYDQMALPLQNLGAAVSEKILAAGGMNITRDGNILKPYGSPDVGVAGACSGLHLLFTFVALGVLMAYMYRRSLWERILIMASSVPIAVFCNIIRVTLMTLASHAIFIEKEAVIHGKATWSTSVPNFIWNQLSGAEAAAKLGSLYENVMNPESYLHQSFGFAMLGLAFGLMWAELKLIDMLFVEEDETETKTTKTPA
jgi:exosortase